MGFGNDFNKVSARIVEVMMENILDDLAAGCAYNGAVEFQRRQLVNQGMQEDVVESLMGEVEARVATTMDEIDRARPKYRWWVIESTPGYLPDSPPDAYETKEEAGDAALAIKRELQDAGYVVHGTRRTGYVAYRRGDDYDLGRVVEIVPYDEFEDFR